MFQTQNIQQKYQIQEQQCSPDLNRNTGSTMPTSLSFKNGISN